MSAVQARLEDVISYSDFSQEVPIQKILVQDLLENRPEDNLLEDLLSGDTPINETVVHVVSIGEFDRIIEVTIYYLKLEQECFMNFPCIFYIFTCIRYYNHFKKVVKRLLCAGSITYALRTYMDNETTGRIFLHALNACI